ncbi:MAG: folate-binding protein [Burkholderiaceae bacterium]
MTAESLTSPAPRAGQWTAPADPLTAITAAPALVGLEELGVIAVSGDDAPKFLQGQLTNDVLELGERFTLNGYCTAKGRLIATFGQWRDAESIYLLLPREILAAVLKRLSMFVLRAKVKLSDVSDPFACHGLVGHGAAALLEQAGITPPATAWESVQAGDLRVARLPAAPGATERFLLLGALPASLAAQPLAAPGVWWWSEIDAAVPTVFAATQEKFVPQMINLEVLGGVNFKKGCYPGQEIVARSQYLGKLRRRMAVAHVRAESVTAGADVFAGADPVGTVVMAAAAPQGGFDLLFESPVDQQLENHLHLVAADGPLLALRPLPYAIFDPTA